MRSGGFLDWPVTYTVGEHKELLYLVANHAFGGLTFKVDQLTPLHTDKKHGGYNKKISIFTQHIIKCPLNVP